MRTRPGRFRLNPRSPLADGLLFAGLPDNRFVGSLTYRDRSIYGRDGVLTGYAGAPLWQFDGDLGRWVLGFDGSNDYVVAPPTTTSRTVWTIAGWVKHVSGIAAFGLGDSGVRPDVALLPARTGKVQIYIADTYRDTGLATPTGWFHAAISRNGAAATTWINGTAYSTPPTADAPLGTFDLRLGRFCGVAQYWAGQVADGLLYDRVLPPADIRALSDPSNTLLRVGGVDGLLPQRTWWPAVVAPSFNPAWAQPTVVIQ